MNASNNEGRILRNGRVVPSVAPLPRSLIIKNQPMQQKRVTKTEWLYPLIPNYLECPQLFYATVCPCVMAYKTANVLLKENNDSGTCYSNLLSLMICSPALFCMERTTTHTLNGLMQQHENDAMMMQSGHNDDEDDLPHAKNYYSDLIYDALEISGFNLEKRKKRGWTNDGRGFDIKEDISEDWWAGQWCCYYTYHSFCCNFLCCRTCNSAPYVPMCFALLCGGIYPVFLCPTTFVLRRSVINAHNISESCFDSAIRSLLCTPCSLMQTSKEIHDDGTLSSIKETPTVVNSM